MCLRLALALLVAFCFLTCTSLGNGPPICSDGSCLPSGTSGTLRARLQSFSFKQSDVTGPQQGAMRTPFLPRLRDSLRERLQRPLFPRLRYALGTISGQLTR